MPFIKTKCINCGTENDFFISKTELSKIPKIKEGSYNKLDLTSMLLSCKSCCCMDFIEISRTYPSK